MLEPRIFDELARRVSALVAATPAKDVEKNLKALLTASLARLDLVTREEFDRERDALDRAKARLVELETKVASLEKGRK